MSNKLDEQAVARESSKPEQNLTNSPKQRALCAALPNASIEGAEPLMKIEKNMSQFRVEVIWNLASFVILGLSGVLINILIGYAYDASALGVFNQVFAVYIFFSQLAVGGIHLSA